MTYDNNPEEALEDITLRLQIEEWMYKLRCVGLSHELIKSIMKEIEIKAAKGEYERRA